MYKRRHATKDTSESKRPGSGSSVKSTEGISESQRNEKLKSLEPPITPKPSSLSSASPSLFPPSSSSSSANKGNDTNTEASPPNQSSIPTNDSNVKSHDQLALHKAMDTNLPSSPQSIKGDGSDSDVKPKVKRRTSPLLTGSAIASEKAPGQSESSISESNTPKQKGRGVQFSSVVTEVPSSNLPSEDVSKPQALPRHKQNIRKANLLNDSKQKTDTNSDASNVESESENKTQEDDLNLPEYESATPSLFPFAGLEIDTQDDEKQKTLASIQVVENVKTKPPPSILKKREAKPKNKVTKEVAIPPPPGPPPPLLQRENAVDDTGSDTKGDLIGKAWQPHKSQQKFTPMDLLNKKRQLKRVNVRDTTFDVQLGRKELFDGDYEKIKVELPEFIPLNIFLENVIYNNTAGNLTSINMNGLDQLSDVTFALLLGRPRGDKGRTFLNVRKVYFAGCPNITDQGLIWVSELFPGLQMLEINGCKKITERGFHYLFTNCPKLANFICMACTAAVIPNSIVNTQLPNGSIAWAGNPIITEGKDYYIKYQGASPEDFFQTNNVKLLIVRDKILPYRVTPLIPGVKEEGIEKESLFVSFVRDVPIPKTPPEDGSHSFNIIETSSEQPLIQSLVSHGSIVMVPFHHPERERSLRWLIYRMAETICSILMKSPDVLILVVEISDKGHEAIFQSVRERLADLVQALADTTFKSYEQNAELEYLDFKGQEGLARGMAILDRLDQLLHNESINKRIVHLATTKEKFSQDIVPALSQCVTLVQQMTPYLCTDWQVHILRIINNLPKCAASTLINVYEKTNQEGIVKRYSALKVKKIINVLEAWGLSLCCSTEKRVVCSTDMQAYEAVCALVCMDQPPLNVWVNCFKVQLAAWSVTSLAEKMKGKNIIGKAEDVLSLLKRQGLLLRLRSEHYTTESGMTEDVYVRWQDVPDKHDCLPTLWPEPRPKVRVIQTNHIYYLMPMAPSGFMPKLIRTLLAIYRPLLVWKTGFMVRQGLVDIKAEIMNLRGSKKNKIPCLVFQSRIIQLDMDAEIGVDAWRQSTDDARTVMFSCSNQIRSIVHYVCQKMNIYAVDMMPCPKCSKFTTESMLDTYNCWHLPFYHALTFKHRSCPQHKMVNVHFLFNSRVEHTEGLITPRHNYPHHNAVSCFLHGMVKARRFRPMDPPEKCFYCGRENDIPCLHCTMCSLCTRLFAKMLKFCQPGGINHRSFKLRLMKDGQFVEEDRIKSNTKGCVFFYKKGVSMEFHHPMVPFYWDQMEFILLRGTKMILQLEFASGKKLKFQSATGKFTDQNNVERDSDWFVSAGSCLIKMRLESVQVGRRVRVVILMLDQVLHTEEVDGWNVKVTVVCNKGGITISYAPGLKKSWQMRDQERYERGVLEMALDDGTIHPAVIKEINPSGYLTLEANGSEHTVIHSSPQLMPTGCARALGKTLQSSLPPAPDGEERLSVPLYVFLDFQVPCGYQKLLELEKDTNKVIDELKFMEIQKKDPALSDYIAPCNIHTNVPPSVLYAKQVQLRDPVESKLYTDGGPNYSLGAMMMLPSPLSLDELNIVPQSVVMKDFRIHPLCYVRSDVNTVMTCLPSHNLYYKMECYHNLHMLDNPGLPLEKLSSQTSQSLGLNSLWAWIMLLLRLQHDPLPEYKHMLNGVVDIDKFTPLKIHEGLRSVLEVMRDAVFLCVGLKTDVMKSLDEESMKRWMDINEEHHSQQSLHIQKIEFVNDNVMMCETHKNTWQTSQLALAPSSSSKPHPQGEQATPMYTGLPGIYHAFIYSLALASNQLTEIPAQLFISMPNLKDLLLSDNNLSSIPSEIGMCKRLNNFAVANNQLTDLPETLAQCQEITRMDLGSNRFDKLPSVITKLQNIERLYCAFLLLTELPEDIGNLTNLMSLALNGNCLTTLPESMANLQKLNNITLNGVAWLKVRPNVLLSREHFEEFLQSNSLIHWLDKHNTDKQNIFSLFDEDVNGTLDPVEMGRLNATMFKVFPRFGYKGRAPPDEDTPSGFPKILLKLKSLEYLSMQYHGLVSLPEEIENLTSLNTIHLGNNPNLLTVPAQLGGLKLKRLELEGCPLLKTPPKEIRTKGFLATHAYLKRLLSGSVSCQRTKLMLVGLGGAGKTSLVKALLSGISRTELTIGEEITDGIDICPWTVNTPEGNITYSVWDFAGQTVYYNTHQFFLTDRAVYFLLWNIRLGHEHAGLDFWLSSIRVHAPKAPIFVVGTHLDQVSKVELPMKEMQARFPQIAGFHFVSSHTGKGIEALQDHMIKVTLTQRYMGEKIPGVWLTFEENLKSIENKSVIEFKELESRAGRSGIFDDNDIRQAVQFLHELGSLQYFTNAGLKSHVVINPQWIVDVMACVVSVKDSPIKSGRFKHADVSKVWKAYDPALHTWMLHLTEQFDLTFPLKDNPINLVPCLLPEKKPEFEWPAVGTGVYAKETKMTYKFDYFPAGLFNRAQVRLHQFSDSALIWKRGSYLKKNGHICLLNQSRDLQLTVKAIGPRPDNILFLVHEVFETLIMESFKGINYDFSVPCPDCLKLHLKDPHMFAASTIRRATELKAPFLQCLKYFHTVSITDLHAIMPPDNNQDFDLHLVQAVRGMKELQRHLASDIFMSYCPLDGTDPESKSVTPDRLCQDVEKWGFKCWMPKSSEPHQTSLDEMAKALQESRVLLVFMSNNYVKDETCCNLFKYARLTLKKQIVLVAVGPNLDWRQSSMGILTSDELYIDMRSMGRYQQKFSELTAMLQEKHNLKLQAKQTYPPCFISYCWQNSAQAVAKGSRTTEGATGYGDPRVIKDFLESNGVSCWIDVERVGLHGLFEDIGVGLLNSKVMLVCMSDQYARSDNCSLEFRYGANTLKLPVALAVVGSGNKWRASEVGIMSLSYPLVSFQENSEAALTKLLDQVKIQLAARGNEEKGKDDENNKENDEHDDVKADEKQKLSLQELCEMAQRKFLRQVNQYAELEDSDPYPNIMLVDFWVEEKGRLEASESEKKNQEVHEVKSDTDTAQPTESQTPSPSPRKGTQGLPDHGEFYQQKFGISLLCEHEEGWHTFGESLPLEDTFGHSLEKFLPYIARVTALARYSRKLTLNLLSSGVGRKYMNWLEENPKVTATSDFHESFQGLRQLVQKADSTNEMGGLRRCILPNGKLTWLCPGHRSRMRVSLLESKQSMPSIQSVSETMGVDLMVKAMREMDFGFLPPKFVKDPAVHDELDGPSTANISSNNPVHDTKSIGPSMQSTNQDTQKQQQYQQQQQQQEHSKETPRGQASRMNSKSRACLLM